MTDREMLELAARSAPSGQTLTAKRLQRLQLLDREGPQRCQVRGTMGIGCRRAKWVEWERDSLDRMTDREQITESGRAIVRAAAEIGRSMP